MLPPPYHRWYVDMSGSAAPVESRSTCDACVMEPGSAGLPPQGAFNPAVRCCTYHPYLAAHFVGAILIDEPDGAGAAIVRARIAAREGVTPLGLGPPPAYDALIQEVSRAPGGFGQRRDILCPFYADARCTIWSHRGAPCAAFHCKYDRGAYGAKLWSLIVVAFNVIERSLASWLLAKQGLDSRLCDQLLHAPTDHELDARAWGHWRGREQEYFVAAARLIAPLSWAEVAALGGAELTQLGAAVHGAVTRFAAMTPPTRVQRGSETLHQLGRGGRTVLQHPALPFDVLEVDTALAERLARLEPTTLAELDLDAALVQKLLDWQVLVPA